MKVYADVMSIGLLHDTPARADVTCVTVGLEGHTRGRLAELGLRPSARLRVLSRTSGGGRIVDVGGVRVALDAVAARAIRVDDAPALAPALRTPAPRTASAAMRGSDTAAGLLPIPA